MTTFGMKARDWRQDRDISLREMAGKLGISAVYLSDIERGHRPAPAGELLEKMAAILEVPLQEMEALARESRKLVFDPKKTPARGFEAAALLARRLDEDDDLSDELLEQLKKVLGR